MTKVVIIITYSLILNVFGYILSLFGVSDDFSLCNWTLNLWVLKMASAAKWLSYSYNYNITIVFIVLSDLKK